MSLHIFRPAEPGQAPTPPVGASRPSLLAVAVRWVLTLLYRARGARQFSAVVHTALMLLGLVVQGVLLLTTAYVCDLALSLMELWAELARKHLELTV